MFKLNILPESQQRLWPLLKDTPHHFVLYGGTAIALQVGHRISVDFDFFTQENFDPLQLYQQISYLKGAQIIQTAPNTLTCQVMPQNMDNPVKFSYFGDLTLRQIKKPVMDATNQVKIASLIDLFGMKCSVVSTRIELKDYLDIYHLLQHGFTLYEGLAAAKAIYQEQYHPLMTLKALGCFEGGDLNELDAQFKTDLLETVSGIDLAKIPTCETSGLIGDE